MDTNLQPGQRANWTVSWDEIGTIVAKSPIKGAWVAWVPSRKAERIVYQSPSFPLHIGDFVPLRVTEWDDDGDFIVGLYYSLKLDGSLGVTDFEALGIDTNNVQHVLSTGWEAINEEKYVEIEAELLRSNEEHRQLMAELNARDEKARLAFLEIAVEEPLTVSYAGFCGVTTWAKVHPGVDLTDVEREIVRSYLRLPPWGIFHEGRDRFKTDSSTH